MTGLTRSVNYFPAFLGAAGASVALLLIADGLRADPIYRVGVGLLPLVWYHLAFLRGRADQGLDQNAVDSVYYLGFLVTLTSLALGAWRMDGHDTKTLLAQFALGLVATGYALVARIDLQAGDPDTDDSDAARLASGAAESWRNVSASAEDTLGRLSQAQAELHKGGAAQLRDVRMELTDAIKVVVGEFRESMKTAVREAAAEVREARVSAISDELTRERADLLTAVRESAEAVKELNSSYTSFSRRLGTATAAIEEAGKAVREMAAQGIEGTTAHAAFTRALAEAQHAAGGLKGSIEGLTDAVAREAATLQTVNLAGTDRLRAQLEEREHRLMAAIAELDAKLNEATSELAKTSRTASEAMSRVALELTDATKSAGAAARVFSDGLATAANNVVDATRRRTTAT